MDMGCDFARVMAVVFQSTPVYNHPDTCDIACMLQALLRSSGIVSSSSTSFESLIGVLHLFSNMALYSHVVAILIFTNCCGITNLLLRNLLLLKIRLFMRVLYYGNLEPCGTYVYVCTA